eukprot:CAMPEP_0206465586 /NCGR_PEP_ID=MMETSP0324_2-20121206/27928_1 /ASSEMBLY_ACC=CAM_ASM_000836 /TAXON_ID=2866 /ORGANISM="Crypthecodinium cohnii, Strain Seligo" /LENGTH=404 /DNA_ID=CAMNT_0053938493 /DNA_START=107 /DNA_END=1321 /DNA_ORIENTATION=-
MGDLAVETFQRRGEVFALLKLGPYAASVKTKLNEEIQKAHEAAKVAAAAVVEPVADTNGAAAENQSWENDQVAEDSSPTNGKTQGKRANAQSNDQGRFQVKRRRGEDEDDKKKKWWEQENDEEQAAAATTENKEEQENKDSWKKDGQNDNKWKKQSWWETKEENNQSWDKKDKWQKKEAKGKGKSRDTPEDMDDGEAANGRGNKKGWGGNDDKNWNSKDQDWKDAKNGKWDKNNWKQGGWNKDEGKGNSKNSWGKKDEEAWESSSWDKKNRGGNAKLSFPGLGDDLPGEKSALPDPTSVTEWVQAQDRLFGHMDKLPAGWIRLRSRKSQEIYYYSLKSGESKEASTPISALPAATGGGARAAAPAAAPAAPALPPDWTVHFSKSTGKTYYYNSKTGNSQFEPPM